ncbi:phage tail tape measure protein [Cellulosimicrobium sp. JZ28]|uniref:phage tail tape measure protein n=1 Tax=Cellulosimicrobium sp. JZ28 TaxID=1906273 RepID=UPI00188D2D0B|nr:phage tail tape measure protein [Cellulosimicrobium sp. JZ28]
MGNAKDFVVNILGDDRTAKAWESFKANAGKAAAGAAAAFAGKEIGEALAANIDSAAITDRLDASLGATASQSQAWGAAASGAYRAAWGESMEEAAAGVEAVVGNISGMRDAAEGDIQATTEKALALSQAMGVDVAESTTTAGILIKNGLAKDATQAFDLITASLQRVPASMRGEALDALNEYSVNFAQLGLSGDQAMAMLVNASANGGIAIDKTGDALKEFTIRATDMSTSSVAAYDALGLNAQEMSNEILAGGDRSAAAFSTIVSGLQGISDPATQANTAIALFGTPLEDLGTSQIPAFLDSLGGAQAGLGETAGAADKMAATLSGNPKARVEELRRSFEGWKQDLVGMPGPVGDIAVGVQAFGGDAAQLATTVGMTVVALNNMKLATVASTVATNAGKVATAASTAAQWLFNTALRANPLGIVLTAVTALVGGLVWFFTKTEAGQKIVQVAWAAIKVAISAVTDWWNNTALPFLQAGWQAIGVMFEKGKQTVSNVMSAILGAVRRVWEWSPLGLIVTNWDKIVGFVKGLPGKIKSAASGMWDGISDAFRGALNKVIRWWNDFKVELKVPKNALTDAIGLAGAGFTINTPNIPFLADGGIATRATLAVIGEGRGPEAVVPLDRLDEFVSNVNRATDRDNGGRAPLHIEHFHADGMSPADVGDAFAWASR